VTPPLLLLFDIDGTLLRGASVDHALALHDALAEVHGVDMRDKPVDAAGRTDNAIARSVLLRAGVTAERIDALAGDVREACCRAFAQRCPDDLTGKLAPAVPEVLDALAAREDVRLSLVTGNFEPVARLKLARAGIGGHFPRGQGAFGSDSEDRAALPPLARRRAGAGREPWPRERTVVIGDTPRDIACARADGIRVIAVATGPFRADRLTEADAVLPDARGLAAALDRLV
jgi:phosphoglycolate phosphatase-like HAD superfamily hydrolase